jgi:hypothetical protein
LGDEDRGRKDRDQRTEDIIQRSEIVDQSIYRFIRGTTQIKWEKMGRLCPQPRGIAFGFHPSTISRSYGAGRPGIIPVK